ncbi:unnamed protein product [Rodentolepis nana]|uniref:Protein rolling stone n=1 Tax=Rodentolepis nana TaxID=102285 RepID=A0A0R3U001_RODNA|nr:unnamed protein product [Rodentolepis nana]
MLHGNNRAMGDKAEGRRTCCQTLGKAFRYEFKCRNLGFSGANYELFPFAQWKWMDKYFYPIYRFFIAVGLLVWACVEIPLGIELRGLKHPWINYFLYATNWSFLTYTFSSSVFAIFCTFYNCKKARFYLPESEFKHTIPAITVFLDVCVNGLPIRLFHTIYPMIYGVIYVTFSYIYYNAGHNKPIYPVLDWSKPGKAASVSATVIAVCVVVQFVLYLLYIGRITLSARLNGRGKVVIDRWWNAGSQATPIDASGEADIEAVEWEEKYQLEQKE